MEEEFHDDNMQVGKEEGDVDDKVEGKRYEDAIDEVDNEDNEDPNGWYT
jgi:hypothetical protein